MSEREDNVYKAKLAEQAERYDGKCVFLISVRCPGISREKSSRLRTMPPLEAILTDTRVFAEGNTFRTGIWWNVLSPNEVFFLFIRALTKI